MCTVSGMGKFANTSKFSILLLRICSDSFFARTGHGQHGDYLFGWKDDSLQRGMDELGKNGCYDDNCSSALKIQDGKDAIACTKASQVDENVGRGGECKSPPKP